MQQKAKGDKVGFSISAIITMMMMFDQEGYDETALLAQIRAGDKAACATCIEVHAPAVYRLGLRLMGNEADAEEVMQETFLSAFQAIDSFEGRSSLQTWLYRIAHNVAMMRLRRPSPPMLSVESNLELGEEGYTVPRQFYDWCCLPEAEFETEMMRLALAQGVGALPETLRGVFVLRELEGISTQATAVALDLSTDVVKTRLHRARLWLREWLSDHFAGQATTPPEARYG
jgi:RNA polymerase sigma-70 factor (ECF subfamily)